VALTVLATLSGCILAILLGRALKGRERNFGRVNFKAAVGRWSDSLQRSVTDRIGRASTTAAFIRASDINDRKDFHGFVSEITRNIPSIEVLAWAPRIPAALRSAHEEAVRKQGIPNYVISQRADGGQLRARGDRKEYYPILFIEPPSPDTGALLGFDLGSDPACLAAMRQATTSGQATVAVYTALSGNKTDGNLLFVLDPARYESVATQLTTRPADQPEADGFVLGVLRMEPLAKRWLGLPGLDIPPSIDVYISANKRDLAALHTGTPPTPILDAAGAVAGPPAQPPPGSVVESEEFEVGSANFKVQYIASAGLAGTWGSWKPTVASLTGLLVTGLAVGYFWLLTGRMAAVERLVADRWLELRERERYIRHLVDNTGDAIFLCDQRGAILDVNRRACESLGYQREELLSMTVADVELPAKADDSQPSLKVVTGDYAQNFEAVHLRKDGTKFPVEVHTTSVGVGQQQLLLAIVRDITDRKRAEGALTT
jgi:PAS domain S-box-containing protein